jgi:rod shape-determining protein MreC
LNRESINRNLLQRGTPIGVRFLGYAALALALMYFDQRGGWLDSIRYVLQSAAYPLRVAVNSPALAWVNTREIFVERAALREENLRLQEQLRELKILALRREDLERENAELRQLQSAVLEVTERWLAARIIEETLDAQRQRLTVNRGGREGTFKGQAVVAGSGVLGQIIDVGPFGSEIILITDPEHSLPVQILRTGQRTLAVGTGKVDELQLPYLPLQTDVEVGDLLVTSGLGGIFPAGFPVGTVSAVSREGGTPLVQVSAKPAARIDRDRHVALLWFREGHPAAP